MRFLKNKNYKKIGFLLVCCLSIFQSTSAKALEFSLAGLDAELSTKLTVGAAWRIADRDDRQLLLLRELRELRVCQGNERRSFRTRKLKTFRLKAYISHLGLRRAKHRAHNNRLCAVPH